MKPDSSPNGFLESFRHARDGLVAASTGRRFRVQLAAGAAAVAVLLLSLAAAFPAEPDAGFAFRLRMEPIRYPNALQRHWRHTLEEHLLLP